MRRLALLTVMALCCASSPYFCGCQRPADASAEPVAAPQPDWTPYFFVGKVGDMSVSIVELVEAEQPYRVLVAHGDSESLHDCRSAALLPDGTILMADLPMGLVALSTEGKQTTLLKPGEVGRSIRLDSSGHLLAFDYPVEYSPNFVYREGIGVYDIQTGERRLLFFKDPPGHCSPLGWLDRSVVFCETDPGTILQVDLEGSVSVVAELTDRVHRFLPMKGDLLAYEIVLGGVGVVNLRSLDSPQVFADATGACWTEAGLEVLIGGKREIVVSLDGER